MFVLCADIWIEIRMKDDGMSGKLLVVEGLDGCGKTTQVALLRAALEQAGVPLRQIKLPDYDDPSSTLVQMYLNGAFGCEPEDVNAYAASSFYAVDRFAGYQRHWKTDYAAGKLILADRYTTSNALYQMVKLPQAQWDSYLAWLRDFEYGKLGIPEPDLVIYLDMPVEISQRLLSNRYAGDEQKKDMHERNTRYLKACREAALYACEKLHFCRIECAMAGEPLEGTEVARQIFSCVEKEMLSC